MYYIDIEHKGLGKFRRVSGIDEYVVQQKAAAQRQVWDDQWQRKCEVERTRLARAHRAQLKEDKKAEAVKRTEEAQQEIETIEQLLSNGLRRPASVEWKTLYDRSHFSEAAPHAPEPLEDPSEPKRSDPKFEPKVDIFAWLFPSVRRKREAAAAEKFHGMHEQWDLAVRAIAEKRQQIFEAYLKQSKEWAGRKEAFMQAQANANIRIDEFQSRYKARDHDAVVDYVDMVLAKSEYPDCFPKQWQMDFIAETGILVVDYELPSLDALPRLKAVKYVQVRDAFEESHLKENELAQLYDRALYQTSLRTLHEVFQADEVDAIRSVTFNGWVDFIDKSNGKPARACVMSVQASKEVLCSINLAAVDPKTCFRSLKGVGSAKLAGMAAVVPILRLNKSDDRFIPAHDAIDGIDEATNVAAISWEEFEYLVRDIFEKEFSRNGGEVKITRASRDHGVDAVAFDPDPIRGGKIVIQAKRYTNVVGVSAVRDLYGTLINEGANRGILVTTSQYGPDSYEFAKDKPITLLDGGNLLSLLERHGHKARIDLDEAKKLGATRDERQK